MTKPDYVMAQKAKTVLTAVRDGDDGRHRPLMVRLGEFFPAAQDFEWLDRDEDQTIETCFTSEDGGWLEQYEDVEFWQIVIGLDIAQPGWAVPESLVQLLDRMVTAWESAASTPVAAYDESAGAQSDTPRFTGIERVPGADYPGWWQGYDTLDQVWKYVENGDWAPDDWTQGWAVSAVAFAEPAAEQEPEHVAEHVPEPVAQSAVTEPSAQTASPAEPKFTEIDHVPGNEYPGWWQGYDLAEKVWKYVHTSGEMPDERSLGWTRDLARAAVAEESGDIAMRVSLDVDDVIAAVYELDSAAQGVSDMEIIDALEQALTAELLVH
ncbi:MAG TPA: hypothetical protein VGM10_14730 [Actinocrinis sp.]|jgi:hypothetical protein